MAAIEAWRESHPGEHKSELEIVKEMLESLGILPGATVETVNNKSNNRSVVIRLAFQLPKPVEVIDYSFCIKPEKKKRKKKLS